MGQALHQVGHRAGLVALARQRVDQGRELRAVLLDLLGVYQVIGELTGHLQHVLDQRGRRADVLGELAAVVAHHPIGQLPRRGLGHEPGVGFGPESQRVLAHQAPGVGGVGGHGGFGRAQQGQVLDVVGLITLDDAAPLGQPAPDPASELGRGLAGERQTENGVRRDDAVRDQPHDPGGHGLGLARAGAGDDDRRAEVGLDDRSLFRASAGAARDAR